MVTTTDLYVKAFDCCVREIRDVKCSARFNSISHDLIHPSTYIIITLAQGDDKTVTGFPVDGVSGIHRTARIITGVGTDSLCSAPLV